MPVYNKIKLQPLYFKNIESNNTRIKNKYLSIHFRNSDMKNDVNLFLNKIKEALNKYTDIKTIYIASDDFHFYDNVANKFPNINIVRKTFFEENLTNLHCYSSDKKKQMYDCLVDIYYILLSDVFIPSLNSSMSRGIVEMIKNNNTIFPNIISNTIIETCVSNS